MRVRAWSAMVIAGWIWTSAAAAQTRYTVSVPDPSQPFYRVTAEFGSPGDTLLVSLPAWTPGHYAIEDYARYVRAFDARSTDGRALDWDKVDKDTWRIAARGARAVQATIDVWADTVNLSQSLLKDDFGFFNGTNLFLFREADYAAPAEVRFRLPPGWTVTTPLRRDGDVYRAPNYHELVDAPTFVGAFSVDSFDVDGATILVAVYPKPVFAGVARDRFLAGVREIAAAQHKLFGGPPYDRYVVLLYLETEPINFGGGLEHSFAQFDILPVPAFADPQGNLGGFVLYLISHELYHAWNVKRIRPAALWPYDYRVEQFTPLLWVSEGITDYYAKVALSRSGLWDDAALWNAIRNDIEEVESEERIEAVEDASLNTWIEPLFISNSYYYPKGSLLGFMLDIRIRDATNNRASLDDVMRALFNDHYRKGKGFTTDDFNRLVAGHLGREATQRFYEAYVDGREPLPYAETFALAGLRYERDSVAEPFLGVFAVPTPDGHGLSVLNVTPGSAAQGAGLQVGDLLLQVGDVEVGDPTWAPRFRARYRGQAGAPLTVVYERDGERRTGESTVQLRTRYEHQVTPVERPSEKALRIRDAIAKGPEGG